MKQMTHLWGGGDVKQKRFLRGYKTKIDNFHCIWKVDLVVLNFEIFKISALFTSSRQVCLPATSSNWFCLDRGPHSQILMTGRSDRGSYFIPKKITTSEFVYPNKSLLFLAYPKKSLSSFFTTQKNTGVFHRPKKITFGQYFRPKKITRTPPPPSLKYVSGTPGEFTSGHQGTSAPSNCENVSL